MKPLMPRLLKTVDNMFGFIWQQPIDVTLKRLNVLHVLLIGSSQVILWRIVDRVGLMDGEYAGVCYVAIATALIGQIWAAVGTLHKPDKRVDNGE